VIDLEQRDGHNGAVDRDLRDWLRSLAHPRGRQPQAVPPDISDEAADYLAQIARDGTLKAALAELGAGDPELSG